MERVERFGVINEGKLGITDWNNTQQKIESGV